jgi:hypothetical protein
MADEDAGAFFSEAFHIGVFGRVGTLHLVAEIEQHLCDAGHANAADADEVYGAEIARQFHSCLR